MRTLKLIWVLMLAAGVAAAQHSSSRAVGATPSRTDASSSSSTTPAAKPTATPAPIRWSERRDPFVSALRVNTGENGSGCSGSKRCLNADEIILRGVVITQDRGNIALVESSSSPGHSTFLFVNDQIFHGSVVKIGSDSLVLRVVVTDELNHKTTRDVVKRVTTPAV